MNNVNTHILFNVGRNERVLDLLCDLLDASGYRVGAIRQNAKIVMLRGEDASVFVPCDKTSVLEYSATSFFEKEKTGRYANLATVALVVTQPLLMIGEHKVTIVKDSVKVGCTTVPWATVEEIVKRHQTL